MNDQENDEGLKRVLGVPGLSLNIVNLTIGAGIFALPAIVSLQLGAFSIYAYVFCGFMMACIMLCYAEIGTRVTSTGGSYAYVTEAFGDLTGFIVNWLAVFGWSILGSAALMNIIADSLSVLFPFFSIPWVRALFFALILGFLVLTNIKGTKESNRLVKWVTVIKLIPLIGIILLGFTMINGDNLHWEQLPSFRTFGNTALILFFAFAGFETALGASGEIKNPNRTIPLGILLGGGMVLIVYILLQIVTQGILGAGMETVKDAPLAAVAEQIIGPIGGTLLLMAAAISCFGVVSSDVLNTSRVLYASAKHGLFPAFLARLHPKFSTPHFSIITFSTLLFIFSITGGFEQLAVLASAAILLIYLLVVLATIKMKLKNQGITEGIFKVPGGLIIPVLGLAAIVWLLTSLSKGEIISTLIFLSAVVLIHFQKV
jgi:amino acid transporter